MAVEKKNTKVITPMTNNRNKLLQCVEPIYADNSCNLVKAREKSRVRTRCDWF